MGVNTLRVGVIVGSVIGNVGCCSIVGMTPTEVEGLLVGVSILVGVTGVTVREHAPSASENTTKNPDLTKSERILFMEEFYNKKGFAVWQTPFTFNF
jgi:hypothetical protein